MTVDKTGAPGDNTTGWRAIDWQKARREVRRLHMRIAKATKEGKHGKVKALQWILTPSFYAKALAVERVTSNKGKKTPGIDGVLWKNAGAKMQAIHRLRQHGYKAQPLRRIYIRKKSGTLRPLSIPTMFDRAMQALYKLALAPVAETTADRNSYGFREGRGCADAVAAAFNALSKPNSATWIWEADISGCFDSLEHEVIEEIIARKIHDKRFLKLLQGMLQAGYMEDWTFHQTYSGTAQGGVASPIIANIVLNELDVFVEDVLIPKYSRGKYRKKNAEYLELVNRAQQARRRGDHGVIMSVLLTRHNENEWLVPADSRVRPVNGEQGCSPVRVFSKEVS